MLPYLHPRPDQKKNVDNLVCPDCLGGQGAGQETSKGKSDPGFLTWLLCLCGSFSLWEQMRLSVVRL